MVFGIGFGVEYQQLFGIGRNFNIHAGAHLVAQAADLVHLLHFEVRKEYAVAGHSQIPFRAGPLFNAANLETAVSANPRTCSCMFVARHRVSVSSSPDQAKDEVWPCLLSPIL